MDISTKRILKTLNPRKVWIPIITGLGIIFFLFYRDPNITADNLKLIFDAKLLGVFFAILFLLSRDIGYVYRLRILVGKKLSVIRSIYVVILWEFASAVTPSVVGGSAIAVFILMKEGIKLGKSLAYVMLTAILDNIFFIIAAPLILLLAKGNIFPPMEGLEAKFGVTLQVFFIISYVLILLYTSLMSYGLLIRPRAFKWLLLKVTSWRFLRKWRKRAYEHGNEIIMASSQLRGKKKSYWLKLSLSTLFIWVARYLMLNALISAFRDIDLGNHIIIFSRQVIMWIVMLISPTPGSSVTAELSFETFFSQILGEYSFVAIVFWRLISYYFYLILGALFLPRWIRYVFFKKNKKEEVSS